MDEWISTTEAARRLGLTQRTVYRLIDKGELPAFKMGRVIRLRTSDLAKFIEASRIRPTS